MDRERRRAELNDSLYLRDPDQLGELLPGEPRYRADQLREWLYQTPVLDTAEMTNLPESLRQRLAGQLWPFTTEREQVGDGGRTRKWLFRTPDGADIEAVLMGYPRRATLCISSQAGCALGCTFCATGQFGFERHLEPGEITAQVAYAKAFLRTVGMPATPDRLTNIVFMGMGEPLANYRRVRESIRRMTEVFGMSARSITVSTVGMAPGIRRLADEPWRVNLAVSLHAADDETRSSIVPINRRYPIADLIEAVRYHATTTRRRPSIEWTMMEGVNDTEEQASLLADIAHQMGAHVNLIPLNPTPLTTETASTHIDEFRAWLVDKRVNTTVRDTRGTDIDAACGQLKIVSQT